ncbi:MAG: cation:proton antiporter [Candidatus Omnitrophota bacterium]
MKIYKITLILFLFIFLLATNLFADTGAVDTGMLDRMMVLVMQLGVIIFVARIGGMVFEKMKMPAIIGEIVSGVIIGPYLLGGIALPLLGQPLFPLHGNFPVSPELYGFTTVASIVLLFLVGLETDLEMFLKYSVAGAFVGIGGVVVSFFLGDMTAVIFSRYIFGAQYGFMHPVPLFMGVISTATSVGITARILSEKKKMQSPEGVTIVSGAVIDDILGIIALTIVIAIAKSGHVEWKQLSAIAIKSIGFWLGFTVLGLLFSRQISNFLKKFKDTTTIAVMAFGLALILAGIFERAGLAMIIGAYIMGLSLSKTDLDFVIQEKLSPLHRFFVPIFFCVMGMMVDFSAMSSKYVIFFGLIYTAASIAGKLIGCGLPALFLNFNMRGALRIGLGMTPRGEVTLLIASIGLSAGILRQDTLGIIIFMTLATALFSPGLLAFSLRSNKPVLRKARPTEETRRHIIFDMPTPETTDLVLSNIISAFSSEGFFIHRLDIGERLQRLYQLRKDEASIGMTTSSSQIEFDCKDEEATFIHTLVYEILAELENTMKKLQALTDKAAIGRKIFDKGNGKALRKKRSITCIHPNAVEVNLKGNTKKEIIEEMLDILIKSGQLNGKSRDSALKDILEREETMSTGMQYGIALPHAKTDAVTQMLCAFGIKKGGIDFSSLDQEPCNIFIMILSPRDVTGPHIRFMADISQVLMDKQKRDELLAAKTNKELYDILMA